ncbi:protein kinase C delta type-like [Orbicella faveolata]|uniref:protein kinase C delta type-like n=1 Tax=Orbicella faveolata TaxID=48498 RepID=UPI0009E312F1|nr:protein kinase C delta type-like [Orbicella faveolata]
MLAGDLQKVFEMHKKRFSELQARFYIAEIICGLEFLHLQGVVHRDLKLQNVLMDEEGHLKIADFGLAVDDMLLGEKIEEDWETGTPSYMAPEVCLISSLENEKLLEIIVSDSGHRVRRARI